MKKIFIAAILTITVIFAAAFTVSGIAYADSDGMDNHVTCYATVGCDSGWVLNDGRGFRVLNILQVRGNLPEGFSYGVSGGDLYLDGRPVSAGTYEFDFTVHVENDAWGDWDDMIYVTLYVEPDGGHSDPDPTPPEHDDPVYPGEMTLPTYYATLTAGKYISLDFAMGYGGHISSGGLISGSVPYGMYCEGTKCAVYVEGTPCAGGVYYFTLGAWNSFEGCWVKQPCCITVKGNTAPYITKNPTGEYVTVGGGTCFVAKACNASSITWLFVSGNSKYVIDAWDAPNYFQGLRVSGCWDETLWIDNVPWSLDGWYVEAKFEGPGGVAYSSPAYICVCPQDTEVAIPVIKKQPSSAILEPGQAATLTVSAYAPDGNNLSFQWYKNDRNDNRTGAEVPGATGTSLSVSYEEGVHYYYCVILNNTSNRSSAPAISDTAFIDGTVRTGAAGNMTPTAAPAQIDSTAAAQAYNTAAPSAPSENTAEALTDTQLMGRTENEAAAAISLSALTGASSLQAEQSSARPEAAAPTMLYLIIWFLSVVIICATILIATGPGRRRSYRGRYDSDNV